MDVEYYIGAKKVSWKTLTLVEYTQTCQSPGWEDVFEAAEDDVIPEISKLLKNYSKRNVIYPPLPFVFNALDSLAPDQVKVVIIGQDPFLINPPLFF